MLGFVRVVKSAGHLGCFRDDGVHPFVDELVEVCGGAEVPRAVLDVVLARGGGGGGGEGFDVILLVVARGSAGVFGV